MKKTTLAAAMLLAPLAACRSSPEATAIGNNAAMLQDSLEAEADNMEAMANNAADQDAAAAMNNAAANLQAASDSVAAAADQAKSNVQR